MSSDLTPDIPLSKHELVHELRVREREAERFAAERDRYRLAWLSASRRARRLRRWKVEALTVMAGLQDLGRALGVPLGASITGPQAGEAARALRERAEKAERERDVARAIRHNALDRAERARAALAEVEKLAREWDQWPNPTSAYRALRNELDAVLARARGAHEHDAAGCIECPCAAAPWSARIVCTCEKGADDD